MWVISLLHFCESWDATKIFRLGVQYFTCWYTLVNMNAVLKGNACWSHEITEIGSYNMGLYIWVCECVSVYVCVYVHACFFCSQPCSGCCHFWYCESFTENVPVHFEIKDKVLHTGVASTDHQFKENQTFSVWFLNNYMSTLQWIFEFLYRVFQLREKNTLEKRCISHYKWHHSSMIVIIQ